MFTFDIFKEFLILTELGKLGKIAKLGKFEFCKNSIIHILKHVFTIPFSTSQTITSGCTNVPTWMVLLQLEKQPRLCCNWF